MFFSLVVPVALLPLLFAAPFLGLTASHAHLAEVVLHLMGVAWAYTAIGYVVAVSGWSVVAPYATDKWTPLMASLIAPSSMRQCGTLTPTLFMAAPSAPVPCIGGDPLRGSGIHSVHVLGGSVRPHRESDCRESRPDSALGALPGASGQGQGHHHRT